MINFITLNNQLYGPFKLLGLSIIKANNNGFKLGVRDFWFYSGDLLVNENVQKGIKVFLYTGSNCYFLYDLLNFKVNSQINYRLIVKF